MKNVSSVGASIFVLFTDVTLEPRTQLKNSEGLVFISTVLLFKMMDTGYKELSPVSPNRKPDFFETTGSFMALS